MKNLSLIYLLLFSFHCFAQEKLMNTPAPVKHFLPGLSAIRQKVAVHAGDLLTTEAQIQKPRPSSSRFWSALTGSLGISWATNSIRHSTDQPISGRPQINAVAIPALGQSVSSSGVSLQINLYDQTGKLVDRTFSTITSMKHTQTLRAMLRATADGYAEVALVNEGKSDIIETGHFINIRRSTSNAIHTPTNQLASLQLPPNQPAGDCATWWSACDCWTACDPNNTGGTFQDPVIVTAPAPGNSSHEPAESSGSAPAPSNNGGMPTQQNNNSPQINKCEYNFAMAHPTVAASAKGIADQVNWLFDNVPELIKRGGNNDNGEANAMKHYIWNILLICSPDVGYKHTLTITTIHEVCEGTIMGTRASYEMDTYNNAKGQEMGLLMKKTGQCGDFNKIIQTALDNLPGLKHY